MVPITPQIAVVVALLSSFKLNNIIAEIPAQYALFVFVVQVARINTIRPREGIPACKRTRLISNSPVTFVNTAPTISKMIPAGQRPMKLEAYTPPRDF